MFLRQVWALTSDACFQDLKPSVSRITSLFLLCQVYLIITHVPLVRVLTWIILTAGEEVFTEKGAAKIADFAAKQVRSRNG